MRKLITIFALLTLTACGKTEEEATATLATKLRGQSITELTYQTLDGQPATVKSLHTGKPLLVNYWATWCIPCVLELPSLLKLQQGGMLDVVAVSFDTDPETVKEFWARKNLGALPLLIDRGGAKTVETFGITGVPTTLILDQQLTIQGVEEGGREWDHASTQAKIYQTLRGEIE